MTDLIFVSMENWDEIWRRNQFVCAELARRHPGMKILFVGLPRDLSHAVRTGRLRDLRRGPAAGAMPPANVHIMRPWKLLPTSLSAGRLFNDWLTRRQVRRTARRLNLSRPLLWLNPHYAVHMVGRMGESGTVYDVTDDWTALSQRPGQAEQTRRQDAELCGKADAVIVCSSRLFELKRGLAARVYLIPNGVDAEHYRSVLDGGKEAAAPTRDWAKPVLGYTGTLHADRVDTALVEQIARRMPEVTVAMIGPCLLPPAELSRLRSCGNVRITGPVPYRDLPGYMRAFDVCITPHRRSAFTESLNPIKLWEYLACGRPIVSTDVAGFRDYPDLVRIASDPEAFVAACRAALLEPPQRARARREEAVRHSWAARVDDVERVIARCLRPTDVSDVHGAELDPRAATPSDRPPGEAASEGGLPAPGGGAPLGAESATAHERT